ncbi:hypothetical protein GCM10027440_06220 [Nocardiopsis coralliicola]
MVAGQQYRPLRRDVVQPLDRGPVHRPARPRCHPPRDLHLASLNTPPNKPTEDYPGPAARLPAATGLRPPSRRRSWEHPAVQRVCGGGCVYRPRIGGMRK